MKQYAVGFFRNKDKQVLLLRRSWSAPWMDYKWSLPGGTVEPGEDALDAFIREVKEEMAVTIKDVDCSLRFSVREKTDEGEYEISYFDVYDSNFTEEDIILNFENDKYQFVDLDDIDGVDLIPNLDIVLEELKNSESFEYPTKQIKIEKSFFDLIQPNPFELDLQKGKLETGKLHLKDVVDKLGRHIKKWVKNDQPEGAKKDAKKEEIGGDEKPKKGEEEKDKKAKKSSDFDYHSIYKDSSVVANHAKKSSTANLKKFVESEEENEHASHLLAAAKAELKNRGELVEAHDKNPFGDEEEPKVEPKSGDKEDKKNWDMNASQNQKPDAAAKDKPKEDKKVEEEPKKEPKAEPKEEAKSEPKEELKKLTSEGKTFDQKEEKPKDEPRANEESAVDEATEKAAKAEKKPYDASKDKNAVKTDEGHYNPDTLEGWNGDNSLDEKHRSKSESLDNQLKSVVSNITDSNMKGDLEMIVGDGGLGKTFEVIQQMKAKGLKEANIDSKEDKGENSKGKFVHLAGDISPAKFYEVIHDFPYSKIIIDDVGKILKDPQGLDMIKAATDTSKNKVTRGRSGGASDEGKRKKLEIDMKDVDAELTSLKGYDDEVLPKNKSKADKLQSKKDKLQIDLDDLGEKRSNQTDFKGQMLIISNKLATDNHKLNEEFFDPLITRTKSGKINELRMNNQAKLYKLSKLVPFFNGRSDATTGKPIKLTGEDRKNTYDYIKKLTNDGKVNDISMRMMGSVSDQMQELKSKGFKGEDIIKEMDKVYYGDKLKKALSPEMIQHFENLILGI